MKTSQAAPNEVMCTEVELLTAVACHPPMFKYPLSFKFNIVIRKVFQVLMSSRHGTVGRAGVARGGRICCSKFTLYRDELIIYQLYCGFIVALQMLCCS